MAVTVTLADLMEFVNCSHDGCEPTDEGVGGDLMFWVPEPVNKYMHYCGKCGVAPLITEKELRKKIRRKWDVYKPQFLLKVEQYVGERRKNNRKYNKRHYDRKKVEKGG